MNDGVSVGLSDAEVVLKTELMAKTWQAHFTLCEELAIVRMPNGSAIANERLRTAQVDYFSAVAAMSQFAACVALRYGDLPLREPTASQSPIEADAARGWIAAYAVFSSIPSELPALTKLEYPSEAILTAFEELPDCP